MPKRFESQSIRPVFARMVCLFAAMGFFAPALFGQTAGQAAISSNRFLFVVDTSSAMKKQVKEMAQVVGDIVNSGANGEMHRGDTLGVWTFNERVASELPVQRWDPDVRTGAAFHTMDFLQRHAYEKSSRVESFLPDLLDLIKHSDVIMVFIISNGDGKIKGTPFDAEINASYESAIRDMHGQRNPIVTILVAKGGNILRYTVNPLPWPITIPQLPPPSPPVAVAAPKPQSATPAPIAARPAPVTTPVPPLIVIGKRAVETADIPETNGTKPIIVESAKPAPIPPAVIASNEPVEIAKSTTEAPAATNTPELAVAPVPTPAPAPMPPAVVAAINHAASEKGPSLTAAPANSLTNRAMAFVAPEKSGRSRILLIVAFGLILVALALIAVMVRRSRVTTGPSLITASLRHEKRDR